MPRIIIAMGQSLSIYFKNFKGDLNQSGIVSEKMNIDAIAVEMNPMARSCFVQRERTKKAMPTINK